MSTPNPTAIDPGHVEAVARALWLDGATWPGAADHWDGKPVTRGDGGVTAPMADYDKVSYRRQARAAILAYTKATSMPVKAGGAGD